MHEILSRNVYLVKEHVGLFKAANNFDICDPESGQIILECREDHLGFLTKFFRFTKYKRMTRFNIQVRTPDGRQVVRVARGVTFFRSRVRVFDDKDQFIGGFKQRLFSIGGRFDVRDAADQSVCTLKGKWTGWEFTFVAPDGREFARVTKKWAGIAKELFTTADNYVLAIGDAVPKDHSVRQLILAAVMCIDMVLKE